MVMTYSLSPPPSAHPPHILLLSTYRIHQAKYEKGFVANDSGMTENDLSKYRVLNQAGVGLFDYYLENSQELWVLFIDRCAYALLTLATLLLHSSRCPSIVMC